MQKYLFFHNLKRWLIKEFLSFLFATLLIFLKFIKNSFSKWKQYEKKYNLENVNKLFGSINQIFDYVNENDINGYYRMML